MGSLIQYSGDDSLKKYSIIKDKCSLQAKVGFSLSYDKENLKIVNKDNNTERAEIIVPLENSPSAMKVIIPFYIAREVLKIKHDASASQCEESRITFKATLRDYQSRDLPEVARILAEKGYCYFKAFPGWGKTVAMSYLISLFKQKTIIVVPTLMLVNQTYKSVGDNLDGCKIVVLENNKPIPEDTDVLICLRNRLNIARTDLKPFTFMIMDEVHMLTTSVGIAGLMSCAPNKILALTATGGERNSITELFVGQCAIERLSQKTWYIAFPNVFSELDDSKYSGVNGYTTAISELSQCSRYICGIINMVRYFRSKDKRIIIITMRIELRDKFERVIRQFLPLSTVSSLGPDKKEKPGNADIVIGTHKCIGTGFDLSNSIENFDGKAADVVFFCGSIKDGTLMYQNAGRAFRSLDSLAIFPCIADLSVSRNHIRKLREEAKSAGGCIILDKYSSFLEYLAQTGPIREILPD